MNMSNWVDSLIHSGAKQSMPILSFPCCQLMDIDVEQLLSSSGKMAEGMRLVADRADSCAQVSFMDLSVEAECFGSKVVFRSGEVPTVVGSIVCCEKDADDLKVPALTHRAPVCVEAMRLASSYIEKPVFAGMIGGFSLAGRLVGVTEAMINCYEEPHMMHKVLAKCTDFLISYAKAFKSTGVNGIIIAEPLTGLLSPELALEFSTPYIKAITDAVQDEEFIIIYHNCGNSVVKIMDTILQTGCKGYHFGNAVDMRGVLKLIPSNVLVMGNVDPASEFLNGTPESIRQTTKKLLTDCSKYANFIISSGCDIPPLTPWANIDAFFAAVAEFYRYNGNKVQS